MPETVTSTLPQAPTRASTRLSFADALGRWRVRLGIRRHLYRVEPGLYAVGSPDADSPVLVTANYKLSFDTVRAELDGLDAWLLILDTNGVNVWCAAGKGTFATNELVRRIEAVGLTDVVSHRRVVVPQLGASGVAARLVRERTGFRAVFGPVRARDIKAYLAAGMRADADMRRVSFTVGERLAVTGTEISRMLKYALPLVLVSWLVWVVAGEGERFAPGRGWWAAVAPFAVAVAAGTIVTPALLPWVPGRAFAVKGALVGAPLVAGTLALLMPYWTPATAVGALLLGTALSSFLAMNYTGCSTFTSPSGVEKEMRSWMPFQAAGILGAVMAFAIGVVL